MRETGKNGYQSIVKKKLKKELPDCEVRKLDPNDIQGIPDLLILCPITWATLETKGYAKAKVQPNQPYYVNKHNDMSFSRMIYPENENEVFDELHKYIKNFDRKKENRK
jgi:hypothetical protein